MSKALIVSGCSFTECRSHDPNNWYTWPKHLHDILKDYGYDVFINKAMGSQGNGLISRSLMYSVSKALTKYKPEDILVGVMWSGSSRLDYMNSRPDLMSWYGSNPDGWMENPTSFVDNAEKKWIIMNPHWTNEEAQIYYKYFYDDVGAAIYSIEHILRLQYFLKDKKVPYFFTNFTDENILINSKYVNDNKHEYDYLYELIDFNNYLPVSSEHRWVYDNATTKEEFRARHLYNGTWCTWIHPNRQEHKEFAEQVIVPYLKNKNMIDTHMNEQ